LLAANLPRNIVPNSNAMDAQTHSINATTFKLAEVTPSTERLSSIKAKEAIERSTKTSLFICPQADFHVIECADFHPLIAAAATAFKQHYPLVLSPDMLWLTVLQGIAQHVANHSESLRTRLVQHQTKIELIVDSPTGALPQNSDEMLAAVKLFTQGIGRHIQPDKAFLLDTEFSTTTDIERIAMSVVLMDTFQPYFDYVFACICGIPSITLEGSPEDWELLESKVISLSKSDLDLSWWTQHLLPLCRHFVRAARKDVDIAHWNNLFKLTDRYGTEDLNGWLLEFIPYVREGKNEAATRKNPVFTSHSEQAIATPEMHRVTGCTSDMLPSGLSAAPVIYQNRSTGEKAPIQFMAGFGGVTQSTDLALRPLITWGISESPMIDRLIGRIRNQHECRAQQECDTENICLHFDGYLPGDLWRFYTTTNGATLKFSIANQWAGKQLRIYPLKEIAPLWSRENIKALENELQFLKRKGLLLDIDVDERATFYSDYKDLMIFASASFKTGDVFYVFGRDPEARFYRKPIEGGTFELTQRESRGEIFRWNGDCIPGAFIPVARTFTEWLTNVFSADAAKVELVNRSRQGQKEISNKRK